MKTKALPKYMRIAIVVLVNFAFTQYAKALTGPGPSWTKVRKITLSTPATTPSANFQVKVTLTTAVFGANYTNIKADGSDLRFYDANDNACSYYIDNWNDAAASNTVWVKVPVAGTGSIYMFYGNTLATVASNGDNTFIFFDDFLGTTLDATKWGSLISGTAAAITVSGGNVILNCGTQQDAALTRGSQIIGKTSFNVSDAVTMETKLGAVATNLCGAKGSMCGASSMLPTSGSFCTFDLAPLNQFAVASVGRGGLFGLWDMQCDATTVNNVQCLYTGASCPVASGGTLPSADLLSVTYSSTNILYSESTKPWNVSSNTNPPTGTVYPILSSLRVPNCMGASSNSVTIDYIRLRKYSSAGDPVSSFGSEFNNLTASISAQTNVLCFGQSTGAATVTGTGGSGVYTYSWNSSPTQSTQTASNLPAGTYTATVTENGLGLAVTASATITQPGSAVGGSISSQTNVLCNGQSTGSVTVAGSGGVGPYTYALGAGSYSSTATFGGLAAANYTVHIKDANLCIYDQGVSITQPATAVGGSITSQTNVFCNGQSTGSVTVAGSGGVGPYTYALGAGSYSSTATFGGLTATNYTVHVKDFNGCIFDQAVSITQPAVVTSAVNGQTNPTCFSGNDGTITILAGGGTAPYQFSVDNGVSWLPGIGINPSFPYPNLSAGVAYKIRVKDTNGCTSKSVQ